MREIAKTVQKERLSFDPKLGQTTGQRSAIATDVQESAMMRDLRFKEQTHKEQTDVMHQVVDAEAIGDFKILPRRGDGKILRRDLLELLGGDAAMTLVVERKAHAVVAKAQAVLFELPFEYCLPLLVRAALPFGHRVRLGDHT